MIEFGYKHLLIFSLLVISLFILFPLNKAEAASQISINSVVPTDPHWGIDKPTVCGESKAIQKTDSIFVNFGDSDNMVSVVPGNSWCVQKPSTYDKSSVGPVNVVVGVYDSSGILETSSTSSIIVKKQLSVVTLGPILNKYWGISFNISGSLKGEDGKAIPTALISFSGSGQGTHTSATTGAMGNYFSTGNSPPAPASTGLILKASFSENNYYFASEATRTYNTLSHPTFVNLNPIDSIPTDTTFSISGNLIDTVTNQGLPGKLVTLGGDGKSNLQNPTTGNLIVSDSISGVEVNSCSNCSENIMRLYPGAEISIPSNPKFVKLTIQDMGTSSFTLEISRVDGSKTTSSGAGQGINAGVFSVGHPSGISKIKVISVSSGTMGISRIQTLSSIDQIFLDIIFSKTDPVSSVILAGGIYSAEGTSSSIVKPLSAGDLPWTVFARFLGQSGFYDPSPTQTPLVNQQTYSTLANFGGVGGAPPGGDVETGITSIVCNSSDDVDKDGLCDSWEGPGHGVPYTVNGATLLFPISGTSVGTRDLLYEMDVMSGQALDPTAISDVKNFFNSLSPPVKLQIFVNEGIPKVDPINVWRDTDNVRGNSFEEIKAARYGLADQHPNLSGTQTNFVTNTSGTDTISVTGISITTPPIATNGKILVNVRMTLSSGISTSTAIIPGTVSVSGTGVGLNISGATAKVSSISTTIKELQIILPFASSSSITASLGTISVPLSLTPTISVSTSPGSPTATTTLLDAKAQAIRYILVADSSGGRSGAAELKGNDIVLTLGSGFTGPAGSIQEQEGTLVHEIGHNLNLDHGGPANLLGQTTSPPSRTDNCKPNQISIMSYSRQLPTYLGADWKLEFGKPIFPNIVENNLNEATGLKSSTSYAPKIVYGTPGLTPNVRVANSAPAGNPNISINWDGDGIPNESSVQGNINNIGITGCNVGSATSYNTSPFVTYDEAANFDFNFRGAVNGQFDGVHVEGNELTTFVIDQQRIASASYSLVPPPDPTGITIRNPGSTIQLKFDLTASTGELINTANAYAEYTTDGIKYTKIGDFVFNGNDGHYMLQFQTPSKPGVYYLNYNVKNPGATPDVRTLADPNNPFEINGHVATVKLTLMK